MKKSRQPSNLTLEKAWLLTQALFFCLVVRIAVWTVPTKALLRFVRKRVDSVPGRETSMNRTIELVGWSVRAVGRRVPKMTCLVEALAVQLLLWRQGYRSDLKIGVLRDSEGNFAAHAWVVAAGKVIVGYRRGMEYKPLPDLVHTLR